MIESEPEIPFHYKTRKIELTPKDEARFWSKVSKDGECWIWKGGRFLMGYGCFAIKRKAYVAHRVSFHISNGPIDPGKCVCHSCDVQLCVNPSHLWVGTTQENTADKVAKGRQSRCGPRNPASGKRHGTFTHPERILRGEKHGGSKITDAIALEMHALRKRGLLIREIADQFGVSIATAGGVISGARWKHVNPAQS